MKCNVFGKKVLFAAAAVIMSAFVLASCSDGSDDDPLSSGTGLGSLDNTDPIESLVTEDTVRVVDFRKVGTGNQAKMPLTLQTGILFLACKNLLENIQLMVLNLMLRILGTVHTNLV